MIARSNVECWIKMNSTKEEIVKRLTEASAGSPVYLFRLIPLTNKTSYFGASLNKIFQANSIAHAFILFRDYLLSNSRDENGNQVDILDVFEVEKINGDLEQRINAILTSLVTNELFRLEPY
jgi:hypothetical protein